MKNKKGKLEKKNNNKKSIKQLDEPIIEQLDDYLDKIESYTPSLKTELNNYRFPELWPEETTNINELNIPKYARLYSSLINLFDKQITLEKERKDNN
jgi:hypothetical protein